jgi:hypothetical protein
MLTDTAWRLAGVLSGIADWLAWLGWSLVAMLPSRRAAAR